MNTSPATTVNTPAVIAVVAVALVVAALFGSPTGSTTSVPANEASTQVAGR